MSDEVICTDIDLMIESLAANGELDEAIRLRKATSRRYSAFDVSNAVLDIIDEGYVVNGHRFSWKFDSGNEVFADSQRLDFRDKILKKLLRA